MKVNLQTDQFRFGDRGNELTNRAVQFRIDTNAVNDELTHRSVHELQIKEM
jgi:site-specific recombinase XerC